MGRLSRRGARGGQQDSKRDERQEGGDQDQRQGTTEGDAAELWDHLTLPAIGCEGRYTRSSVIVVLVTC